MDSLIDNFDNASLNTKCSICKKIIYSNEMCRDCFLHYLDFMDFKECCTCGKIFKPIYNDHYECGNCLSNY